MAAFFSNAVSPVTRLSVEQYGDVAEDLATAAVGKLGELLVCDRSALGDAACAGKFITDFGLRAFRRPLTAIEAERYRGLFEDSSVRGFGVRSGGSHPGSRMIYTGPETPLAPETNQLMGLAEVQSFGSTDTKTGNLTGFI